MSKTTQDCRYIDSLVAMQCKDNRIAIYRDTSLNFALVSKLALMSVHDQSSLFIHNLWQVILMALFCVTLSRVHPLLHGCGLLVATLLVNTRILLDINIERVNGGFPNQTPPSDSTY